MKKFKFYHSVMNSGKSTQLLQYNYNYKSEGHKVLLLTSNNDDRFGLGKITSRLNVYLNQECIAVKKDDNVIDIFLEQQKKMGKIFCILVDEAQFFTPEQIKQFSDIVDFYDTHVWAFGLIINYKAELFAGTQALINWADEYIEIKRNCHCGEEANKILRYNKNGEIFRDGEEIIIGSEDQYQSVCRKHYKLGNLGPKIYQRLGIQDPFKDEDQVIDTYLKERK